MIHKNSSWEQKRRGKERKKKKQFSTIQQQFVINIQYSLIKCESPDSRMIIL